MSRPKIFVDRTATTPTTPFGDALRRLRTRRQLSLGQLAALAGMNTSSLSQLESGAADGPKPSTVLRLAEVLQDTKHDLEYAALATRYARLRAQMDVVRQQMQELE